MDMLNRRELVAVGLGSALSGCSVGLIQFPQARPDRTAAASLVQDPGFDRLTSMYEMADAGVNEAIRYFWQTDDPGPAAISIQHGSASGGGVLRLSEPTGVSGQVWSVPRVSARYVAGEWVRLSARLRRTVNVSVPAGVFLVLRAASMSPNGFSWQHVTAQSFGLDDINGWTLNAWQEFVFEIQTPTTYNSDRPYLSVGVAWSDDLNGQVFEVDFLNLIQIAEPA
jgi:hypothetical protein